MTLKMKRDEVLLWFLLAPGPCPELLRHHWASVSFSCPSQEIALALKILFCIVYERKIEAIILKYGNTTSVSLELKEKEEDTE